MELVIQRDKLESSTEREGENKGKEQERKEWREKAEMFGNKMTKKMRCGYYKVRNGLNREITTIEKE